MSETSNVELINFKGSTLKNVLMNEIKIILKEKCSKLDFVKVKQDLIDFVSQVLRRIIVLKDEKKLVLKDDELILFVVEVINSILPLTNTETDLVKASVNFLLNNKLIKRVAYHKRAKRFIWSFFKKA
jgi:hypothetical protein